MRTACKYYARLLNIGGMRVVHQSNQIIGGPYSPSLAFAIAPWVEHVYGIVPLAISGGLGTSRIFPVAKPTYFETEEVDDHKQCVKHT